MSHLCPSTNGRTHRGIAPRRPLRWGPLPQAADEGEDANSNFSPNGGFRRLRASRKETRRRGAFCRRVCLASAPAPRENFGWGGRSAKWGSPLESPLPAKQWANPQGHRLAPSALMGPLPQAADVGEDEKFITSSEEFRRLRASRKASRPPPRRLLQKAGENFGLGGQVSQVGKRA